MLSFIGACLMLAVRFKKITRERAMEIVAESIKFGIAITIIRYVIKGYRVNYRMGRV